MLTTPSVHRFSESGDNLHEISISQSIVSGSVRWDLAITTLDFAVDESDLDSATAPSKYGARAVASWISPYENPADRPSSLELPCSFSWTQGHVYVIFGACEVYVCRIVLIPEGSGTSDEWRYDVTSLQNPVYLPASTTEREFFFAPLTVGDVEYAVIAIAGNAEFPPVLMYKEVQAELGGWVECCGLVGPGRTEDPGDMKGLYSCDALRYLVPIRSGLEWNKRLQVVCG